MKSLFKTLAIYYILHPRKRQKVFPRAKEMLYYYDPQSIGIQTHARDVRKKFCLFIPLFTCSYFVIKLTKKTKHFKDSDITSFYMKKVISQMTNPQKSLNTMIIK